MIETNEYLAMFTGSNSNNKIGETYIYEILLHSMSKVWVKQDFLPVFVF